MLIIKQKGNFYNAIKFLNDEHYVKNELLKQYCDDGLRALKESTPVKTGKTSESWGYEIVKTKDKMTISFYNTNTTENNIPIVLLLQYGHATRNGGWVSGHDFINPTIKPIFDKIEKEAWKEVTS